MTDDALNARRHEAAEEARPRHRIYLGMAAGVGKTYAALQELHRLRAAGARVLVGYVETYHRPGTLEALGDLEVVPRRTIDYHGVQLEEMDVDEVLLRHPDVVLVDEIAHTNAPGSAHAKRWQDAQALLDAGISVISTLNIHHLESLADIVSAITGVEVHERIPDQVVDAADELELIDLSPRALRQRIEHGDVYPADTAEQALRRYFREGNLTALRELALRKVSTEVERQLEGYMREQTVHAVWPAGERVMVAVDGAQSAGTRIRRAWHMANRYQADLLAVFVVTPGWQNVSSDRRSAVEDNLRLAEDLGADVVRIEDDDVAAGLLRAAREHNVAHLVVGHSRRGLLHEVIGTSVAHKLLRLTQDIDIHVVAARD